MPNPNALVDGVNSVAPLTESTTAQSTAQGSQYRSVTFQSGRSALLDLAQPRSQVWAEVLEDLRRTNQPVYIEIEPETNLISELLLPIVYRVGEITPTTDGMTVELIISHAIHTLQRSNPDYDELLATLETARDQRTAVIVTETLNEHEIIDVREAPAPFVEADAAPQDIRPEMAPPASVVTMQRARELFALVNARVCCAGNPTAPCIPFTYPDDGCWGRAHEMARLMIGQGVQPEKIWIYGSLNTPTHNHPQCRVLWGWHVAPTLRVNIGGNIQPYVIDPSLFNDPVTTTTWKSVQGDPNASLQPSDADLFHRSKNASWTETDPTYSKTVQVLNTYRNLLKLRSASTVGPPPYETCIPRAPGVQWYGTIAANASHRWFTWGWPAKWHMLWTVMPLTPCPGGPQLSWTVQVERANSTTCTYWITVRNLTAGPVRFEGRYDILSR
ncbi:MAG: protein-glutamine glutaminase family protein [Chloroflexota bacterium]|nr:protein-glutamine glutaminase family protein [Chloroflexota bacterium]